MVVKQGHNRDSGVRDLTKAHNFYRKGVDTVYRRDGALQGLVLLPSGSNLIQN